MHFFGVFSHCAYHAVIILHHQVNPFGTVKFKQEAFFVRRTADYYRGTCFLLTTVGRLKGGSLVNRSSRDLFFWERSSYYRGRPFRCINP